jgi:hypothetical protein
METIRRDSTDIEQLIDKPGEQPVPLGAAELVRHEGLTGGGRALRVHARLRELSRAGQPIAEL